MTRRESLSGLATCFATVLVPGFFGVRKANAGKGDFKIPGERIMKLPKAGTEGEVSLETTIKSRRTVRSFASTPLTLGQLAQLFWAAQGITEDRGYKRAAPSGGALYPMDIYGVVGVNCVEGIKAGIWHYQPRDHSVSLVSEGDLRSEVARASLSQMWMANAPVSFVITSEYKRITGKYGRRGVRYAMIEAGHVGQNIFLQSEALGLGAGIVGAFDDRDVVSTLKIPQSHEPLLIMPVGYKS
jgi:SagB-type dehydrogenase family enzyme